MFNFDSKSLKVNWISFNREGLTDLETVARHLFSQFKSNG